MKFNLKNRPKIKFTETNENVLGMPIIVSGDLEAFKRIEKWFEGFEKELREMKPTDEEFNEAQMLRDFEVAERDRLINEILGEFE